MFSKIRLLIMTAFIIGNVHASWKGAQQAIKQSNSSSRLKNLIIELVEGGYYYSALPMMKEYLTKDTKNLSSEVERAFAKMIQVVGIKQFETLPYRYLVRSRSPSIGYIMAKKLFRERKYAKALTNLKRIPSSHPVYAYARNMEATIYALKGMNRQAFEVFEECENIAVEAGNKSLKLNRDYCIAGKARAKFALKDHSQSDLLYLDISKESRIWPEILFEEAWNSFYQKNYNRTLGKLVSYKAPVFQRFFNPEVDVLNALTYLKLCLYADAKQVSDRFYKSYWNDFKKLNRYLNRTGKRFDRYYDLMVNYEQFGKTLSPLMSTLLQGVQGEVAFEVLKRQLLEANNEFERIRAKSNSAFKNFVVKNLEEAVRSQKMIIGSYIRGKLSSYYSQLYNAFEGMSYIKLEVLAQRKAKLYSFDQKDRKRGDIKYIQRNEKQYFWDFNGEFWADELGDYVFGLKSEC
ncbi:MAG: hypothetical protein QF441_00150 [Bacteriovoracaceae bacterium]|nr:hypothetical protein [Halobacteriovoraceae bacterium]MDP7318980.1 hypothetical protein [Bacteriovoracaceae bacterium]